MMHNCMTVCCAEDMRFNDGKVSPQGVFVVGRMHSKWRDGKAGRLYRLDPGSRWDTPDLAACLCG